MDAQSEFDEQVRHAFATRLRMAREEAGFQTGEAFAEHLGVAGHRYRHWERGEHMPDLNQLLRLCEALNVEPNEFLPLAIKTPQSEGSAELFRSLLPAHRYGPPTLEKLEQRINDLAQTLERDHVDIAGAVDDAGAARRKVDLIEDKLLDIEEEAGDRLPNFAKRVAVRIKAFEEAEARYNHARSEFWWWARLGAFILALNIAWLWSTSR